MGKDDKNPYVAVPASLGGILLVIVLFFLIFSPENVIFASSIAWAFVILGIFALFFVYLSQKGSRKKKK